MMVNVTIESKGLALQLRENEDRYITGELDLKVSLERTDQLFNEALEQSVLEEEHTTANKILHDSNLMKLQTRLARQCAKYYKPDSLVFNPTEFSIKLDQFLGQSTNQRQTSQKMDELLWTKMGDFAKKLLYTVPSFSFIHGTFDPDPVEVVKKKRKMREKDKIGAATKPQSMSLNESADNQDIMITEAQRVLSVFVKLCKKTEENLVCYFEFVTDPTSFSRTVENIFILSLLAKEGCIKIIKDKNGSPYLAPVSERERKERNPAAVKQCIVSISKEEWQDIVRTFKFKKPLIPPRKAITHSEANS